MARGLLIIWPWIFIGALPPFKFGIWMDVEGVAFYCSLLATIASFILCVWSFSSKNQLIMSRASFLWGGMTLLAVLFWPFSFLKELSWFGHPEGCLGIWFLMTCFILSILFHSTLQKDPFFYRTVSLSLVGSIVTLLVLTFFFHPYYLNWLKGEWIIYHFTAYLIWPAIGLLLITHVPYTFWKRFALFSLSFMCILLSHSKVIYLLVLCSPIFLLKKLHSYLHRPLYKNCLLLLCISIPFLTMVFLISAYTIDLFPTLISRFTSIEVIFQHFIHQPLWRLVTGFGFGYTTDAIILMKPFLNQAAQGGWEGFGRFDASCLHQFLDMIHAIGIGGGILFFLFLSGPLYTLRHFATCSSLKTYELKKLFFPAFLAVVMAITLSSFWFFMISTFFMMFFGYLIHEKDDPVFVIPVHHMRWSGLIFFIVSVSLLCTSFSLYRTGLFFSGDFQKTSLPVALGWTQQPFTTDIALQHGGPNLLHLSFWIKHAATSDKTATAVEKIVWDFLKHTHPYNPTEALTQSFSLFLHHK